MPMARVPGPLQTITGPTGIVVARTPCILNSSVQTASIAAITHGKYSGRQPAITALIAIFSTVSSTKSGGATATTSCGAREVPASMRITRSGVGGTTGKPSVKPRAKSASNSSSAAAMSIRRACKTSPPNRTRSLSTTSGSTLIEPQPGRNSGSSLPRSSMPVSSRHSFRTQPAVRAVSTPFWRKISVGTVSISACQLAAKSKSLTASTPSGNFGSSCVYTVSDGSSCVRRAMTGTIITQVAHSRLTIKVHPSRSGFCEAVIN